MYVDDLTISGSGSTNGGRFNNVNISGSCKINGDIEANAIKISGSATMSGNVKSGRYIVNGFGSVRGNLEGGIVRNNGRLKVVGESRAMEFTNSGSSLVRGHLKAERIRSVGRLVVGGGVETEEFDSYGSLKVGGLLNGHRIKIKIKGMCFTKELGGEEIQVSFSDSNIFGLFGNLLVKPVLRLFKRGYNQLTAELIEGTTISLEHTNAKTVRGDKVTIGPKCKIELVEYKESITIHPKAIVKQHLKV
ncbi:hypothetical protein EFBL_1034 [Effusibacillus lacus]|uniref:Polymer-forming cytoskeletal protein n=2 Tax=Effusibacillus lacus TaxID=1348429 RepID=A0A292YJT2_9BACL|nr:hypothetical protein EFBL_1034 [Effusibacillus lacus]